MLFVFGLWVCGFAILLVWCRIWCSWLFDLLVVLYLVISSVTCCVWVVLGFCVVVYIFVVGCVFVCVDAGFG